MKIRQLAIALLGLLLCASVSAQSYVPLQAGHTGPWAPAGVVGEGLVPAAGYTDTGAAFFFTSIYLPWQGVTRAWFAQGPVAEHCTPIGCAFPAYEHVDAVATKRGTLTVFADWTSLTGHRLHWLVTIDDDGTGAEIKRSGYLRALLRVPGIHIGRCGVWTGPFPAPPQADPDWCVH